MSLARVLFWITIILLWLALFWWPTVALVPFLAIMATEATLRVRYRRGLALLSYLEQAVRLNLPLPVMVLAASYSESGAMKRRLAALAGRLESGQPLADTLRQTAPELSPRAISLVAAGERTGRLANALSYLTARPIESDSRIHTYELAYPLVLALVMTTIIIGMAVMITPKFVEIFADFNAPLPRSTSLLMQWSDQYGPTLAMVVSLLTLALLAAMVLLLAFGQYRLLAPIGWLVDSLAWYCPGLRGIVRDRGLADVFASVSASLEAGIPLVSALDEAGQLHINRHLRRRVIRWSRRIEGGGAIGESARRAHLPRLVSGLLAPADAAQSDHASVARFLARYYAGRFSRALTVLRAVLGPAVTLIMGSIVGWIVISTFLPIVSLIEAVFDPQLLGGAIR